MANDPAYKYAPDEVYAPGETLRGLLQAREIKQTELASYLGTSEKALSQLINGKVGLSQEMALKLQRVLGVQASFWNNLEARYQEYLTFKREEDRLRKQEAFLKCFPLNEMRKRGWIPKRKREEIVESLRDLLGFFGVASVEAWHGVWETAEVAFLQSQKVTTSHYAVAAWLRRCELVSRRQVPAYDEEAFKEVLREVRQLACQMPVEWKRNLEDRCASAGVNVVLVEQLPKTGVQGATRWMNGRPLLMLTLRYKRADSFWFAFFHEAAHILLHSRNQVFLELDEPDTLAEVELEANEWARDFLIPKWSWNQFVSASGGRFTESRIVEFSHSAGVHSGTVVGRLQHEGLLKYDEQNSLKIHLSWDK